MTAAAFSRRTVLTGGVATLALPRPTFAAPVRADNDIDILRRAYGELHPGLLRYSSAREIDARLSVLDQQWRRSATLAQRYLAISRFLGTIRCGHSYANFFNQKTSVAQTLFTGKNRLPFDFRWLGNAMIVVRDPSGAMPPGTRIEAIDRRPPAEILTALLPLARADGANDAKRRRLLSVDSENDYETFDIFYPMVFRIEDRFAIRARTPSGKLLARTFDPIDLETRRRQRVQKPSADPDGPHWTISHQGKSAILKMDGWALYDSKWDWRAWLDTAFDDMVRRDTDRLIIDIRGTEGGDDCGNAIIARLIDRPFPLNDYSRRTRYRRVPDDLIPYLDTWDPSFRDWGADATRADDRFYDLKLQSGDVAIAQKQPRFRGKVIVLTSAENSSATFQFAALIQQHRLGTLVGEATGGNLRGINGGAFFFLRLPESGLEVDLPLIGTFAKSPQPDRGILPDIAIPPTESDIATGRDAALEFALAR